jgi:uncharacterized membrane protein YfcA
VTWQLALTGAMVGVLVGATGMGGGSLMTPLLVLVFGFKPTVAVGTDILHGAVFKTFGAARHRQLGTVQARLSGWMLIGSAPLSLAGVAVATWIDHHFNHARSIEGRVLGTALLVGTAGLVAKSLVRFRAAADEPFVMRPRDRWAAIVIGIFGGFIVGLTSVGSGVFFALWLLIVFPLKSQKVVGTDIFHAALLLWVAGIGHFVAGNVNLHAVAWLLVGSIPGVLIGSQLTVHVPDRYLRLILAAALGVSGLQLVHAPGGGLVTVVGMVVLLAVYIGVALRSRDLPVLTGAESREPAKLG